MKKVGLVNLICSLIAVTVFVIAIMLTMIFTDIIKAEPEEPVFLFTVLYTVADIMVAK